MSLTQPNSNCADLSRPKSFCFGGDWALKNDLSTAIYAAWFCRKYGGKGCKDRWKGGMENAESSKCGMRITESGRVGVKVHFLGKQAIFNHGRNTDRTRAVREPSGRRDADRCGRDARTPLSRAGAGHRVAHDGCPGGTVGVGEGSGQ